MITLYSTCYIDYEMKTFTYIISQNIINEMHNLVKITQYGNIEENNNIIETFGHFKKYNWEAINHIINIFQDDVIGKLEAKYIVDI